MVRDVLPRSPVRETAVVGNDSIMAAHVKAAPRTSCEGVRREARSLSLGGRLQQSSASDDATFGMDHSSFLLAHARSAPRMACEGGRERVKLAGPVSPGSSKSASPGVSPGKEDAIASEEPGAARVTPDGPEKGSVVRRRVQSWSEERTPRTGDVHSPRGDSRCSTPTEPETRPCAAVDEEQKADGACASDATHVPVAGAASAARRLRSTALAELAADPINSPAVLLYVTLFIFVIALTWPW